MKPARIFLPSLGTAEWRAKLADPYLHWRRKKSAWELAVSWESRRAEEFGLPPEIEAIFSAHSTFAGARLLMAVPEHRVKLDDDRRPSQNDLWAMLLLTHGYASVAIEAKAGEEFDKTIEEWMTKESEGKADRLRFLTDLLKLPISPPGNIRYQLLHRTASAVIEADRWNAPTALMLVQCFKESSSSWNDYCNFAKLLEIAPKRGSISGSRSIRNTELFVGWVDSPMADDATAAKAI
jgi:hypothetical protein